MKRKRIDILGVKVDRVTLTEAVKRVGEMIEERGKHYIVTPNPEFVVLAQKDQEFRRILNQADLVVPDGIGLLAAAKFLATKSRFNNRLIRAIDLFLSGLKVGGWVLANQKRLNVLPEQVSGSDLVKHLAKLCAKKGYSMAFLGGKEGVANQAAECLKKEFPHLKIEGTWDGAEADAILKARQPKISSDLFLVALGHPKQERWIAANLSRLEVKVAIGVGGAFDYLVGHPKRAPIFVRRLGLEWVWRLLREPKRLGRILTAFPYFPLLVFWRKIIRDNA